MKALALAAAITVASIGTAAQAAVVLANNPTVTSLGTFGPGIYTITATGVAQLSDVPNDFATGPDGIPVVPVTSPGYDTYCQAGCDNDIFQGGITGPGGPGRFLGSLLGSLIANPTAPGDFFAIGAGTTITLSTTGSIYAQVNDTFYPNNSGGFDVSVSAVPEPTTWAMMIGGFGVIGGTMRRRQRQTVRVSIG